MGEQDCFFASRVAVPSGQFRLTTLKFNYCKERSLGSGLPGAGGPGGRNVFSMGKVLATNQSSKYYLQIMQLRLFVQAFPSQKKDVKSKVRFGDVAGLEQAKAGCANPGFGRGCTYNRLWVVARFERAAWLRIAGRGCRVRGLPQKSSQVREAWGACAQRHAAESWLRFGFLLTTQRTQWQVGSLWDRLAPGRLCLPRLIDALGERQTAS